MVVTLCGEISEAEVAGTCASSVGLTVLRDVAVVVVSRGDDGSSGLDVIDVVCLVEVVNGILSEVEGGTVGLTGVVVLLVVNGATGVKDLVVFAEVAEGKGTVSVSTKDTG